MIDNSMTGLDSEPVFHVHILCVPPSSFHRADHSFGDGISGCIEALPLTYTSDGFRGCATIHGAVFTKGQSTMHGYPSVPFVWGGGLFLAALSSAV